MGKKLSRASTKICKSTDKKQFNSLIGVLRPKVYITDSSNFKRLVQELTGNENGNENGNGNGNPVSFHKHSIFKVPVMEVPAITEIEDHAYQERSLDSSEASMPTSFAAAGSPQVAYVSDTFSVLESSLASHKMDFLPYREIDSWLLEIDPCSYDCL